MNFFRSSKNTHKSHFTRHLYKAIQELDSHGLGRKRKQLDQEAQKILKQKEALIKKIRTLEERERAYNGEKKRYESLVKTVSRKISYEETAPLSERQKELRAFCLDASHSNTQDSPTL